MNTKLAENATKPNGLKTVLGSRQRQRSQVTIDPLPMGPLPDCQPTPK
jgi:hypothetical protein